MQIDFANLKYQYKLYKKDELPMNPYVSNEEIK